MTSEARVEKSASNPVGDPSADESKVISGTTWKANCLYLFRLTNVRQEHGHTHADVEVYMYNRKKTTDGEINDITEGVMGRVYKKTIYPIGFAFADLRMRRRSFVVVVVDDGDATLNSIDFILDDDHMSASHTFENETPIKAFGTVTGVFFRNPIKKKCGKWEDTPKVPEVFEVNIVFGSRTGVVGRTHDDSAANLGPPKV